MVHGNKRSPLIDWHVLAHADACFLFIRWLIAMLLPLMSCVAFVSASCPCFISRTSDVLTASFGQGKCRHNVKRCLRTTCASLLHWAWDATCEAVSNRWKLWFENIRNSIEELCLMFFCFLFSNLCLRSHAVMKLERSNSIRDAQAVTPVTRRISLSVVSPHPPLGPLATEPMEDQMNQNQVTEKYHFHFESNEVESVDDGDDDEIQEAKTIDSVNREDSTELVVGDVIGIQALPELPGPEKLLRRTGRTALCCFVVQRKCSSMVRHKDSYRRIESNDTLWCRCCATRQQGDLDQNTVEKVQAGAEGPVREISEIFFSQS